MGKVERYKAMYKRGLITIEQLQKLVDKGIISQSDYDVIIND